MTLPEHPDLAVRSYGGHPEQFEMQIASLGDWAEDDGGDYVAHLTRDDVDFSVYRRDAVLSEQQVLRYDTVAAHLIFAIKTLNRDLSPARTGRLFRVALESQDAIVMYYSVTGRQSLVGIEAVAADPDAGEGPEELPRERSESVDRALTARVNTLRANLGRPPENLGGWLTHETPPQPAEPGEREARQAEGRQLTARGSTGLPWLDERLRSAVDVHDLHYLALYRNGEQVLSVDVFAALSSVRVFAAPEERRRFYLGLSGTLDEAIAQLGRVCSPVMKEAPDRLVLDVESGAIYVRRLTVTDMLVGVTLWQDQVADTDRKLGTLVHQLAAALTVAG